MGDFTLFERVVELEGAVKVLVDELARVRVGLDAVALWVDREEEKRRGIAKRMAKARAGRGKKKG